MSGDAPARPALRYHGGKWRLAPWIISNFPRHRIYVEPFGGGASVLFRKPRSYAEVYNDLWGEVVNVFRVLRDPSKADRLTELIRLTPFARDEFDETGSDQVKEIGDSVERARRTIFRSFSGFGSAATNAAHSTGFRANTARPYTTPAHDWVNYPGLIRQFTKRLQGVVIENRDAIQLIGEHDGADTLFYVDPPYPQGTRNLDRGNAVYAHDMSDDDHRNLAKVLHQATGMVVLSGYPCPLYDDELYSNWTRIERTAYADGRRKRTEVLWISPAADMRQSQMSLFDHPDTRQQQETDR